jgi:hypothetical protein
MTIRSDLSALDWKYRAKRNGQSPSEYAASVEIYRRPARHWTAWAVAAALVLGAIVLGAT